MEKILSNFKSYLLIFLIFLFPFFFLPFTQEFFITNKLYFLAAGGLLLILISTFQFLVSKKLVWQKRPFDYLVLLFLTTIALSTLLSSPNKIQALFNPNFGLVMMIFLTILYFYLSRVVVIPSEVEGSKQKDFSTPLRSARNDIVIRIFSFSTFLLSILTIVFFFQPFKNPGFTLLGSQLDLAVFLGFLAIYQILRLLTIKSASVKTSADKQSNNRTMKQSIIHYLLLTINLLALFLTISQLTSNLLILPPFRLSWYAVLEALKNPQTAFFGVGIDNFSSVFTRVKDLAYNQSSLWQINSFNVSRSAILHIFTETGILGLVTFGLLIVSVLRVILNSFQDPNKMPKQVRHDKIHIFSFLYLLICLFIFPTSLIIWFLFFVTLSVIASTSMSLRAERSNLSVNSAKQSQKEIASSSSTPRDDNRLDLSNLLPIYLGIVIISFGLIIVSGYFLGRTYAAEYYFKKSLDGIVKNNLKEVYDNQRQAIILNPYIERFRSNFAQTNLVIANNLVQKQAKEITEQDKQTVTQAIQAAIAEAKAATSLNPQKADSWKNLAAIYRNIINVAQGSDVWTISAYQRAIVMDPQNPLYRVDLGGVYYYLGKYDEAVKFFEQATELKPDWPNAQYNYAWANFQKGNYPQAASAMQNVLNLLDPKLNKTDYEKAQKDLAEFKKKLPEEKEASPESK